MHNARLTVGEGHLSDSQDPAGVAEGHRCVRSFWDPPLPPHRRVCETIACIGERRRRKGKRISPKAKLACQASSGEWVCRLVSCRTHAVVLFSFHALALTRLSFSLAREKQTRGRDFGKRKRARGFLRVFPPLRLHIGRASDWGARRDAPERPHARLAHVALRVPILTTVGSVFLSPLADPTATTQSLAARRSGGCFKLRRLLQARSPARRLRAE